MTAPPTPLHLEVIGLRKRFGARQALDGLDLEVRRGEVLGLLGPNGAGKTTFVRLLLGLERPDAGRLLLDGAPPPRGWLRRLGVAPQELALYDELTGRENVTFFGRLHGLRGAALRARVEDALAFVMLDERADERVAGWSGGMQRRLNLAVALVHEPELLVLDEPTVGVDPQSRALLLERVRALRDAGRTVVYTSHHMDEVERVCDRVAVVDRGRLLDAGTPDELVARHAGRAPDAPGGLARAPLERAFLALTGRALRD